MNSAAVERGTRTGNVVKIRAEIGITVVESKYCPRRRKKKEEKKNAGKKSALPISSSSYLVCALLQCNAAMLCAAVVGRWRTAPKIDLPILAGGDLSRRASQPASAAAMRLCNSVSPARPASTHPDSVPLFYSPERRRGFRLRGGPIVGKNCDVAAHYLSRSICPQRA